jgi:hypothetical protein
MFKLASHVAPTLVFALSGCRYVNELGTNLASQCLSIPLVHSARRCGADAVRVLAISSTSIKDRRRTGSYLGVTYEPNSILARKR